MSGERRTRSEILSLLAVCSNLLRKINRQVETGFRIGLIEKDLAANISLFKTYQDDLFKLIDSYPRFGGEINRILSRFYDIEIKYNLLKEQINEREEINEMNQNFNDESHLNLPTIERNRIEIIEIPRKKVPINYEENNFKQTINSIQRKVNLLINDINIIIEQILNNDYANNFKYSIFRNNAIILTENEIDMHKYAMLLLSMFKNLTQEIFKNGGGVGLNFKNISALPSATIEQRKIKGLTLLKRLLEVHFALHKTDFIYDFRKFSRDDFRKNIYHREFLIRLFILLNALPINTTANGFYILQASFIVSNKGENEVMNRIWYIHPHSSTHLLIGLFNMLRYPDIINIENESTTSDPISILRNLLNLRYIRFMPIKTFLQREDENTERKLARGELQSEPLMRDFLIKLSDSNFVFSEIETYTLHPMYIHNTLIPEARNLIRQDQMRLYEAAGDENFTDEDRQRNWSYHIGGFFPFYHLTDLDLTRYQIAKSKDDFIQNKVIYDKSCLIYALEMSEQFNEEEIEQISSICYGRVIPIRKLVEICRTLNFAIKLKRIYTSERHPSRVYYIGDNNATRIIKIGLIEQHFFIIDKKIKVTGFYIKNYKILQELIKDRRLDLINSDDRFRINNVRVNRNYELSFATEESRYLDSFALIKLLVKQNLVSPVMFSDVISLDMILYKDINLGNKKEYLGKLDYNESLCLRSFKEYNQIVKTKPVSKNAMKINTLSKKENKEMIGKALVFYADFETFTVDNQGRPLDKHLPFLCCATHNETEQIEIFEGLDCGKQLLDYIVRIIKTESRFKNWCPLVYFHNLGYDINFLAKYGIINSLPRGRKMLCCEIIYQNIIITFKDSVSLLPMKLESFGNIFGLKVHKEIFPYNFYTPERYFNTETDGKALLQEVLDFTGWNTGDKYYTFIENIRKVEDIDEDEEINIFDMRKYARFYCCKDVEVLKAGVNMFIESIRQDFGIEATNYLSISSIADAIFNKKVYNRIDNLYKVSGIVREFLSYAVHGGRVMPSENKKWAYMLTAPEIRKGFGLCDFDAVSLYPSAISRLWLVDGKPQVFTEEQLIGNSYVFNSNYSAYVVEILITDIKKPRQFPLVIGRNPDTGSILNTNKAPVSMTVCDIELEDLINFQQIEFKTIRGYYWTGNKHFEIQDCIKNIFKKRAEYKKQGNPIQNVYKLIMNSIYGKTILKPHKSKFTYIKRDDPELKRLFKHHASEIQYINQIDDSDILAIKRTKPIGLHFNFSLFGIHILAMSKRIMNEVMCLAEDLGMRIYYQDTDSMHIERHNLDILASEFKKKYGRELIGSNLGQFHSDFELKPNSTNVRSIEAYFIGKKCYIDRLIDDQGNEGFHMRLKGVPQASIIELANEKFGGNVMEVFRQLAIGNVLRFNLLAGNGIKFDYTRAMTIKNKEHFERNVGFTKTLPPENYENGAFIYLDPEGGELIEDRVSKRLI